MATLQAPIALFSIGEGPSTAAEIARVSGIRKELINNYMSLLSAPFLAIAVYYLLQVIGTSIADPVLVLVALGAGLVSETIIVRIEEVVISTVNQIKRTTPSDELKRAGGEDKKKEELSRESPALRREEPAVQGSSGIGREGSTGSGGSTKDAGK